MSAFPAYLSPTPAGGLYWGELTEGRLLRRYKRFLADVRLVDGTVVTAHTANTGAMLGCSKSGRPVWLSRHETPGRKYPYTWEMIRMPTGLVGVNTGVPNKLVRAALLAGRVPEFPRPAAVRSEVVCGESRLDLCVETDGMPPALVEIKNCSLVEDGTAYFPDAVTARGARHLEELARLAAGGARAVIFILAQRGDAKRFRPADHIDPHWGAVLRRVVGEGVELLAYRARLSRRKIELAARLPVEL